MSASNRLKSITISMNKLQILSLVAATSLLLPRCMTTYDRNGQPVHSVDPGLAVVGIGGAGLIGENQTPPKELNSTNRQAFNSPAISHTCPKLRIFGSFGGGGITSEHPAGSVSPRLPATYVWAPSVTWCPLPISNIPKPFCPYLDANDQLEFEKSLMLE